ncbi:MAG: hypothetical protein C0395_00405 [Gemmatimonas sp.]|nr:hypothetical protein [Gemmatimonas sp.]
MLPAGGARGPAAGEHQERRLLLPDRDELPLLAAALPHQGDPDHVRRPPGRRLEDVQTDRLGSDVDGLGPAAAARTARPRRSGLKLSVVIVHFNTSDDLGRCLDALARCPPTCDHAVTVVDNASTDPGLAAVREAHPGVRWLVNARNEGYARGCNRGLRAADADFTLLLNPDVVVQPGAIDALLRAAEAHPRAGLLGPQLLNEDGTIQESCRRFYTLGTLLMRRTVLGRLAPNSRAVARHLMRDFDHLATRPVDWVIGGCVLVRREAVARVGAMDERFFLYFEDVDWCYRMGQAGYDVLYVAESRFVHRHRRDSARGPMRRSFWLHLTSLISFYEKWGLLVYLLKRWRDPLGTFAFWLTDLAALNASLLAAYALRGALNPFFDDPLLPLAWYQPLFVFANLLTSLGFLLLGRYRRGARGRSPRAGDRMQQVAAVTLLLWASTYMSHQHVYSRVVLLLFWPLLLGTLLLSETAFLALRRRMERGYLSLERTLLVGADAGVRDWLERGPDPRGCGLDVVGYLAADVAEEGTARSGPDVPRLGAPADLVDIVDRYRIAQVVFWQWPTGAAPECGRWRCCAGAGSGCVGGWTPRRCCRPAPAPRNSAAPRAPCSIPGRRGPAGTSPAASPPRPWACCCCRCACRRLRWRGCGAAGRTGTSWRRPPARSRWPAPGACSAVAMADPAACCGNPPWPGP